MCHAPYFLWVISRRNFHWRPFLFIRAAVHASRIPKVFEHSDMAASCSCGGILRYRKFLRKTAEEFRSQSIAWHTEMASVENQPCKVVVFSQCFRIPAQLHHELLRSASQGVLLGAGAAYIRSTSCYHSSECQHLIDDIVSGLRSVQLDSPNHPRGTFLCGDVRLHV